MSEQEVLLEELKRRPVLTIADVMAATNTSRPKMYSWIGEIERMSDAEAPFPVRRVGNRYKIPTKPFLTWLLGDESSHGDVTPASTSVGGAGIRQAIRCKRDGTPIDPTKYYRRGDRAILGADLIAGTW